MAMPGSELAEAAKNAGIVLTAASGAAYACGYLVVRARAHALGTDPGFTLIDQNYVFAGVRFVMLTLFALLLAAPLLLAVRMAGRGIARLDPAPLLGVEWGAVLILGCATIVAFVLTFAVANVLLEPPNGGRAMLTDAVLGRNNLGVLAIVVTTAVAAVALLWVRSQLAAIGAFDAVSTVLILIAGLLFVLLPMQHGVFLADRKVRQLDRLPDGVTGLTAPVWLVDRGAGDRAVLFCRDAGGNGKLVTVKADKLDGIGVIRVTTLAGMMDEESRP